MAESLMARVAIIEVGLKIGKSKWLDPPEIERATIADLIREYRAASQIIAKLGYKADYDAKIVLDWLDRNGVKR